MRPVFIPSLLALGLSACSTTPSPMPAAAVPVIPHQWRETASGSAQLASDWWQSFGDPKLSSHIEAALTNNLDIMVADARIREADALVRQARSALLPSLDLAGSAQDAQSLNPFGALSQSENATAQLQAAYEVDLWGRVRNSNESARASLQASQYARDTIALSISAATARAYVTLLSLDAQLDLAQNTLTSRNAALHLAKRRADAGHTSRLELAQATAEQRAAARQIPALELAIIRQENAVRLLTGDNPGPVDRGRFAQLRLLTPQPNMPSALLSRRPDIAQAEAQLVATDHALAASKASLLPQLRLTASLGELFVKGIDPLTIWSVGGSVLAPLFNNGRLKAGVDASEARRDQAAFAYRKTVLTAFGEVENALVGVYRLQRQSTDAKAQQDALVEALRHASNRYRAGYASYLEELDAQRNLFNVELALVQLQEARIINTITLYQALGGGWSVPTNPAQQ